MSEMFKSDKTPDSLECRNKDLENMEDLPKEKVERKDGLPTVDDFKELMGKEESSDQSETDRKAKELGDFIEVVIRIKP
jgi:hypothetical protein